MRQQFDGRFVPSRELATDCGFKSLSDLTASIPTTLAGASNAGDIWATALSVALLRRRFAQFADEWELVANKVCSPLNILTTLSIHHLVVDIAGYFVVVVTNWERP
jgi:hypothetical protein